MNVPILIVIFIAFRQLHALPLEQTVAANDQQPSSFGSVLRNRAVWTLSIFMMLYVG